MTSRQYKWMLCLSSIFILGAENALANDPYGCWIMPGLNYRISEKKYFCGQFGWNPPQGLFLAYGNFILRPKPNLDINLGYMYIDVAHTEVHESTFMNGLTARIPLGAYLIETRNLVWNRFVTNGEDQHYLRNRIRLMKPFKGALHFTPYLYDEANYSFTKGKFTRNRLGGGFLVNVHKHMTLEANYARQNDALLGKLNIFFVMLTVQVFR